MNRRDLSRALLASATGAASLPQSSQAPACSPACHSRTAAEITAKVTPTNYAYAPGNVKRYGAVADWNGVTGTNNAPAFNDAIQVLFAQGGGVLYVPQGYYRIASALNFCGTGKLPGLHGNTPIIVQGEGMPNPFDTGSWTTYGGSWVVGQTGDWIADCTGIQFLKFDNIGFRGTGTGASNKGILCARSTAATFAQDISFSKCVVWVDTFLESTPVGSIAIANNGAEQLVMEQCWLIADTPYTVTFKNSTDLALSSIYATIADSPISSALMNHRNCVFQALAGYAMHIQGATDIDFDTCIWTKLWQPYQSAATGSINTDYEVGTYVLSHGSIYVCKKKGKSDGPGPSSTRTGIIAGTATWNYHAPDTLYGIRLLAGGRRGTGHCQDIRIKGQVERFAGAIRFDDDQTYDIDVKLMVPSPAAAYVSTGRVVMTGCKFDIHHVLGSTGQYVVDSQSAATMVGGDIVVYAGDRGPTANANLTAEGVIIRGQNADVSGALGFAAGSSYFAIGLGGTTIQQSVGLAIVPNARNNAAAGTSPNVPTSYLKPDGRIQLAGMFVPVGASLTIASGIAAGTIAPGHRPNREVYATVYISGTPHYARVLANGQIIFGGAVVGASSQTANIDGISYNLNN